MAAQIDIENALYTNGWTIMYQNTTRPDGSTYHVCVVNDSSNICYMSGMGETEADALNSAVTSMRNLDVVLDGAVSAVDALDAE